MGEHESSTFAVRFATTDHEGAEKAFDRVAILHLTCRQNFAVLLFELGSPGILVDFSDEFSSRILCWVRHLLVFCEVMCFVVTPE